MSQANISIIAASNDSSKPAANNKSNQTKQHKSKKAIQEPKYLLYDFEFTRTVFTEPCFMPFFEFACKEYAMDFMVYYMIVKRFIATTAAAAVPTVGSISNNNNNPTMITKFYAQMKHFIEGKVPRQFLVSSKAAASANSNSPPLSPSSSVPSGNIMVQLHRCLHEIEKCTSINANHSSCILYDLLVANFVEPNAPFELNLANSTRTKILKEYSQIKNNQQQQAQKQDRQQQEEDQNTVPDYTDLNRVLVETLATLETTLAKDVFARFKRSKVFIAIATSSAIVVDLAQIGGIERSVRESAPYVLTMPRMKNSIITDDDVKLCKILLMDHFHWQLVHQAAQDLKSNRYSCIYWSNFSALTEDTAKHYGHMYTFKVTSIFDCTAEAFMEMYLSDEHYMEISELKFAECVDVKKPTNENEYYSTLLKERKSAMFNLVKREFVHASAVIKQQCHVDHVLESKVKENTTSLQEIEDEAVSTSAEEEENSTTTKNDNISSRQSLYFIFKYCEDEKLGMPNAKFAFKDGYVRGTSYGVVHVMDLGDGRCSYNSVFMVNTKGNLENTSHTPNALSIYFVKQHIQKTMLMFHDKVKKLVAVEASNASDAPVKQQQYKDVFGLYNPYKKYNEIYGSKQ